MRLIDANALMKQPPDIHDTYDESGDYDYAHGYTINAIKNATTVDAVPVTRCWDCRYYLNSSEKCGLIDTRLHFYETGKRWTEESFCAWGERKGGDE